MDVDGPSAVGVDGDVDEGGGFAAGVVAVAVFGGGELELSAAVILGEWPGGVDEEVGAGDHGPFAFRPGQEQGVVAVLDAVVDGDDAGAGGGEGAEHLPEPGGDFVVSVFVAAVDPEGFADGVDDDEAGAVAEDEVADPGDGGGGGLGLGVEVVEPFGDDLGGDAEVAEAGDDGDLVGVFPVEPNDVAGFVELAVQANRATKLLPTPSAPWR